MFDIPNDFEDEHPLELAGASPDMTAAREKLQSVLGSMPPWQPDNAVFKGGPDEQTKERRRRLAELRAN